PQPGVTSQASGFSAQTATPTPTSLSDVASAARAWVREHISPEEEQRLKEAAEQAARKAAKAAKGVGHVVKDAAIVAMAHTTTSPATEAPAGAVPASKTKTGFVLVDDDPAASLSDGAQGSAHVLRDDIKDRLKAGIHYVAVDHAAHIRARQYGNYLDPSAGQRVKTVFTVIVEMIPLNIIPIPLLDFYGLGDLITLIEGILGRTIDGLHLSLLERMIYLVATAIPGVPARPVVGVYRRVEPWLRHEDTLEQRAASAQVLHKTSGKLMSAGWLFLLSQLPPWLRRSIPDIDDSRYPRSPSFRRRRAIASFLWTPFLAYFVLTAFRALDVGITDGAQALFAGDRLGHILLLDGLLSATPNQQIIALGILVIIVAAFISVCFIGQQAYRDRVRESLVLAMRTKPSEAHAEMVDRINDTFWQQGSPMSGKLAQSLKHIQDMSVKTAKGVALPLLKQEVKYAVFSLALATMASVSGVALALVLGGIGV
ncbi:MAG: hypothetical protein ACRD72_21065, partial [Candidatus Angelobacter sp.]